MSAGRPFESRSTTLALLAAALLLMGFAAASQKAPARGVRIPCQNTGHAPCR
jgi:hypothetical protein